MHVLNEVIACILIDKAGVRRRSRKHASTPTKAQRNSLPSTIKAAVSHLVTAARRVMEMEEVLEARMVWTGVTCTQGSGYTSRVSNDNASLKKSVPLNQ